MVAKEWMGGLLRTPPRYVTVAEAMRESAEGPHRDALDAIQIALPGRDRCPTVFHGGSGSPLVYLHSGAGIDARDPVALALATHHELFAPVHPGFERLADLDEINDLHDLAFYYDELLKALDLYRVPILGHSFGAMVAAELAAHVPARVSRLMLAAPIQLWRDDERIADMFAVQQLAVDRDGCHHPDAFSRGIAAVGRFLWPIADRGLRMRLGRITAPTLLLWGSEDRFVPIGYAAKFAAEIPNATVEVLPGAGHMAPVEQLPAFVACVEAFLAADSVEMTRAWGQQLE
jgi:pimeloyl-ACP methyl ester carboxylesterase